MEFNITTPAVLFPAVSLLMLAYTNRFLAISTLIRSLKDKFVENGEENLILQIRNLRRRVFLIRNMQFLAALSLFLCVLSMFFIFENRPITARNIFAGGMVCLIISLAMSLREIHLSIVALSVELKDIEAHLGERKNFMRKIEELEF
jgi:Protein of unknown function (DUF2721)